MQAGALIGGKYRLTRQIGEGAMGVVWAAVNEATLREVAIKLILRSTEELRLRLRREARTAGGLKHPNVIEIYDIGETADGDPFLIMPLLSGETLSELLERQRRLEPQVAARIARDVARALAAAQAGHIIHRDLKPANIFLHQESDAELPVVKVLDFGVSKNLGASDGLMTATGGVVGSPAYMSPEQARVEKDIDHRSDIWALGVVLFEMLTGVRPFKGDANQVVPQIVAAEIPLVSRFVRHIDPALVTLVSRCLERDRDKRIGSAAELANALQRFVNPGPSGALGQSSSDLVSPLAIGGAPLNTPTPPRAPFGSRPDVDPSARSPRLDGLPPAAAASDDGVDEEDLAQTARFDPKMAAKLLQQRPSVPGPQAGPRPSATPAPRAEVTPPSPPMRPAPTAPLSAFNQGAGPGQPFGSTPSWPAVGGPRGTLPVQNAGAAAPSAMMTPNGTERIGGGNTGSWPRATEQPGFAPSNSQGPEKLRGTVKLSAAFSAGLPRVSFGAGPSPVSSTAPLVQKPAVDPALSNNAAQNSRRQVGMAAVLGVVVGISGLLGFGLYRLVASFSKAPAPAGAEATAPSASATPPAIASAVAPVPSPPETAPPEVSAPPVILPPASSSPVIPSVVPSSTPRPGPVSPPRSTGSPASKPAPKSTGNLPPWLKQATGKKHDPSGI